MTPEIRHPVPMRTWPLGLFMVLAVALVTALLAWDHRRESRAALADFAAEQATLASSVARALATRVAAVEKGALSEDVLFDGAAAVERPGVTHVLILPAQDPELLRFLEAQRRRGLLAGKWPSHDLLGTDGRPVSFAPVREAMVKRLTSVWLGRAEAAELGLPPRRAAAGIGYFGGDTGWAVAVVTTAERVRDREIWASYRLTLGVLVAAGLVFAFGSAALRRQRQGMLLERELALADLARRRDAELGVASRAATLGTLAMGIAHEVSTPLGVIAGRAEQLLPKVAGDDRAARSVRAILDQAERIRRVIRGFLDVVRAGAPALGDTPPGAVVEGAVALVEHRFNASGVTLSTEVAPDLPAVHVDVPMLQQAIVNLLLNARDACSTGGQVTVSVGRTEGRVVFTVIDDGRGITPEEAARATELFFTTKAPGQGTGLGLAITSEIVKLHRGRLTLEPASPRGTRARIEIPIPQEPAHAAA